MDSPKKLTLLDYYMTTRPEGLWATLAFFTVLALAAVILARKAGIPFRLALVPLAFVPFLIGIIGAANNAIMLIHNTQFPPDYSNHIETPVSAYHEILHVVPLAGWETVILLVVASAALMCSPGKAGLEKTMDTGVGQ